MLSAPVKIKPASHNELERAVDFFRVTPLLDASYQVAVKGRLDRIVGFVGLVPPLYRGAAGAFHWRIVPRYAGLELEKELVCKAIDRSCELGAGGVETSDMIEAGSAADQLLDSFGFDVVLADDIYEIELAKGRARVDRLRCLPNRYAVPLDANVIPPGEDTWPAAAGLAIQHGLLPERFANLDLSQTPFASDSAVLLVRGKVRGVILAMVRGRIVEVAAMVVDEELRSGRHWANTLLSYVFGIWMTPLGVELLRFRAHPKQSREIRNFALRCGGRIVARQHARALKLPSHEPAAAA